jgi:hypothetical protein
MNKILNSIKSFLTSRPLIRFYRVVGFGILSVILVSLSNLIPQLNLSPEINGTVILFLTGAINAVDKYRRDILTVEK